MKRGSFAVLVVSSLAFGPTAAGTAHAASLPAHLSSRSPLKVHPQRLRLAHRLHAALHHEFGTLTPARTRSLVRRLPHHHAAGTVPATYSLDELSQSRNVIATGPGESGYTRADSASGSLDMWTDPRGRVHYTLSSEEPPAR